MLICQETASDGQIHASDPWLSRCFVSQLLVPTDQTSSDYISTLDKEVYGDPSYPIKFRIGNGGAGYTGTLRILADAYIEEHGSEFRIAWVSNHSRHSQLALLAGVVQVALTYEPENEDLSIREGWAERVCRAFNDHFVLAGPDVELHAHGVTDAFRAIAESHAEPEIEGYAFHSRGDGSATFAKERRIWKAAGLDVKALDWVETFPLVPFDALLKAEKEGAFLLTDRATYLTAKRDGVIPSLRAHVEGGMELMNPCSALVGSPRLVTRLEHVPESHAAARDFAEWLGGERAQELVRKYGMEWPLGMPLFTVGNEEEFNERSSLVQRC